MKKPWQHRWGLLAAGVVVYAAALIFLVMAAVSVIGRTPESSWDSFWAWGKTDSWRFWWYWCGLPVLIIVATQAVFVAPLVKPDLSIRHGSRPMLLSLLAIAIVAAALAVGLLCALLELINVWDDKLDLNENVWGWPVVPLALIASWALWSWLFVLFTRKKRDERLLGRLVGLLLGGTVIEVLAVLPVDLMVRRRTDCYCATGTFNALLLATLAALWLAGPGVLILYLRRRRRNA